MQDALREVMVLCDAVPTRAHDMAKDYHLREIGRIVNVKGLYHVVKAALSAADAKENWSVEYTENLEYAILLLRKISKML
jgi:hypothetical protein